MISKEDEKRVLEFATSYRKQANEVSEYKDQLEELKGKISSALELMQNSRETELKFLDELRDKYDTNQEEVTQIIQKIILANG
tara:strand:+ start:10304 stop:10552 length:249 start_codon:yes stop_codon:yes gene_type:complete